MQHLQMCAGCAGRPVPQRRAGHNGASIERHISSVQRNNAVATTIKYCLPAHTPRQRTQTVRDPAPSREGASAYNTLSWDARTAGAATTNSGTPGGLGARAPEPQGNAIKRCKTPKGALLTGCPTSRQHTTATSTVPVGVNRHAVHARCCCGDCDQQATPCVCVLTAARCHGLSCRCCQHDTGCCPCSAWQVQHSRTAMERGEPNQQRT